MFQKEILNNQAFGVVGELAVDGPNRIIPAVLQSDDETNNVIGRAFTVVSGATGSTDTSADPKPIIAQAGGNGVFAGILINPKSHVAFGSDLEPTSTVKNNVAVELLTMGEVIVELEGAAKIGDAIYYDTNTGALIVPVPGQGIPEGAIDLPNAVVSRFDNTAPSIAVIKLTN